jgi:hypothetical protein
MKKPVLPVAVIAGAFFTLTVVTAQAAQFGTNPNAGTDVVVRDIVHPLAPVTITQSIDPDTLVDGTSVACMGAGGVTFETSWLRLFDLDDDHGLTGTFNVDSVDWGIEMVTGALDLTVNVYCLDEGLPFLYQFMTLMDTVVVPLTDQELTFHNTEIGGACDTATQDLAIDLHAEDCSIVGCIRCFIGMNNLGQTAPTYVAAASCSIDDPLDLQDLGFMDSHLVMKVNGPVGDDDGGYPDDGGGGVPATTGVGGVLLMLILLGGGAYFLKQRATG